MPPKKRAKTSHRGPPINGVSPPNAISAPWPALCGMPLEILLTIARTGELSPEDLYNLAQTCKKIRGCLWTQAAEREWRISIGDAAWIGSIPEQPPCIGIPAYMHLLFGFRCQICGCSMRSFLDVHLVRVCKRCVPKAFVWYGDAAKQVRSVDGDLSDAILPRTDLSRCFAVMYPSGDKNDRSKNLVLQRDVDRVIKRYKKLPMPVSKDGLLAFTNKLGLNCGARQYYAREIKRWLERNHRDDMREGRQKRFNDILARLREEGWEPELEYLTENHTLQGMSKLPFVHQSTKLTDAGWPKVWKVLGPFLDKTREYRLQNEYRAVMSARLDVLREAIIAHCVRLPRKPSMDIHPRPIDLAFAPKCRAILDRPLSEDVTPGQFARVLPGLVRNWNADVRKQLMGHLRQYIKQIPTRVDPLCLAIAVFTCRHCARYDNMIISNRQWPGIVAHNCLHETDDETPSAASDLYTRTLMHLHKTAEQLEHDEAKGWLKLSSSDGPFNTRCLEDGAAARMPIERMTRIVSALGFDATRATIEELNACGRWLRCTLCESKDPKEPVKCVYDWQAAYKHEHEHFRDKSNAKARGLWQLVEQQAVLDAIPALDESSSRKRRTTWCCSLCRTYNDDHVNRIKAHLATEHGIEDLAQAISDGTVYKNAHQSWDQGRCVKISPLKRKHGSDSDSDSDSDVDSDD